MPEDVIAVLVVVDSVDRESIYRNSLPILTNFGIRERQPLQVHRNFTLRAKNAFFM
jgi:hypothetical protein